MKQSTNEIAPTYTCDYCGGSWKREKTVVTHKCKIRDRYRNKDEVSNRLALMAFTLFWNWSYPNSKPKTEMDFIKSTFFEDFLTYGKFMVAVKIVSLERYTKYLLTNNIPIKHWCDEKIFELFIDRIIKTEAPEVAVERSIETMEKWAYENASTFERYFLEANPTQILRSIKHGAISPWVVYNTKSGKDFMRRLTIVHIQTLYELINPDYWKFEFKKNANEVAAIVAVLEGVGL